MNLEQLKKAYRKGRLVPFIGAGLSVPLEMPGWGALIDSISNDFDYDLSIQKKDLLNKFITEYRYLDAVDEMVSTGIIESDLKSAISNTIYKNKKHNIKKHPENIYTYLAKMNCRMYLTTNYDNYLSDYIGKGPSDITHLYDEYINELHDPIYGENVYNLHGDFTKPSTIIISRDSYNKLYVKNKRFKKVLNYIREHYVLLFIGVSLDDEYIQKVLQVAGGKLRAKHYILLSDISNDKRKVLEEKYDIRIIKYSKENNNHTNGIKDVLKEIMHVSEEIADSNTLNIPQIKKPVPSILTDKQERAPLIENLHSVHLKDSKIYTEIQEIKKNQKNGDIFIAIDKYTEIFQRSIFEPLSTEEKTLIVKGLLYNYILIRDYSSAKPLIEMTNQLPESIANIDLLTYIIDYYFNLNDYESAYKVCNKWYSSHPSNPLIYCLNIYTKTAASYLTYENALSNLLTSEYKISIETEEKDEKQFIFRLTGELALHNKMYKEAVILLRKAYELDDNIFNIEDLGIATFFSAIETADDGSVIKINAINIGELKKAIEYFETSMVRAKGDLLQGVYSRIATLYLRSLFYLGRFIDFDKSYDLLFEFCNDNIYEVHRMKVISDIHLNKIDMDIVNRLNKIDRALLLTEHYNKQGLYEHALSEIKPIADNHKSTNEELFLQLLNTLFNSNNKKLFNEYFIKYKDHWSTSNHFIIMKSYFHEINGEDISAEDILSKLTEEAPTITNYNLLVAFYRRTGKLDFIGTVYEDILHKGTDLINSAPDEFYITYFEYLIEMNKIEKAYLLFKRASKSIADSDMFKIMEVELKVRLLDFTNVTENSLYIYDKYKDYGESIFIYYAAVAQLHYNNIEQSRQYLKTYKNNGYISERSLHLVKHVENKLDILQKRKEITNKGKSHHLKDIAYNIIKKSQSIRIPKNDIVIIDGPALYILFHLQKKSWLINNEKVLITFTTIEQLQNAYSFSGDDTLLTILNFITTNRNFKITSPSMESQIISRENTKLRPIDFYDSLNLTIQTGYSFITGYPSPLGFKNGEPLLLPIGLNTIKVLNNEIKIFNG